MAVEDAAEPGRTWARAGTDMSWEKETQDMELWHLKIVKPVKLENLMKLGSQGCFDETLEGTLQMSDVLMSFLILNNWVWVLYLFLDIVDRFDRWIKDKNYEKSLEGCK